MRFPATGRSSFYLPVTRYMALSEIANANESWPTHFSLFMDNRDVCVIHIRSRGNVAR
jgi:hypothetical protein